MRHWAAVGPFNLQRPEKPPHVVRLSCAAIRPLGASRERALSECRFHGEGHSDQSLSPVGCSVVSRAREKCGGPRWDGSRTRRFAKASLPSTRPPTSGTRSERRSLCCRTPTPQPTYATSRVPATAQRLADHARLPYANRRMTRRDCSGPGQCSRRSASPDAQKTLRRATATMRASSSWPTTGVKSGTKSSGMAR